MLSIARAALICGQVLNVYHTDSRATQGEAAGGPAGELYNTWQHDSPGAQENLFLTPSSMTPTFSYTFDHASYSGTISFPAGVYIDGKFSGGADGKLIYVLNPTNGELIAQVAEGTPADVDRAVAAAQRAYETSWGLKVPGFERGKLLIRLAELIEAHADHLAAIETLNNGMAFSMARNFAVPESAACFRYYGGWADKIHGKVVETNDSKLNYVLHEPIGVVGAIIPWNAPLIMAAWKLAPALATGNTVVLKPSELTPLSALYLCQLISEAGFPPGVVNVVNGYGPVVGAAIAGHMHIEKVAFTGSTAVGRSIMKAAATSNLKRVTLELGGKSPNIIFEDADLEQAVRWAALGIFFNQGQTCCAGSRIYVQESIFNVFLEKFKAHTRTLKIGDPFDAETFQGPQISKRQFDRIMGYIELGKRAGATVELGGGRYGSEGYFIQPTIFTNVAPDMQIVCEEIFGPVVVLVKFRDEDDVVAQANNTTYGLAAGVFSQNVSRALSVARRLHAGTVWVNEYTKVHMQVPFGGFKQSGIGRECGKYALDNYTNVKAVHVNIHDRL